MSIRSLIESYVASVPPSCNVLGFGADPTGTPDSAPAIQAAIDAAGANPNGGRVYRRASSPGPRR
jgi:polygalacturonase